MSISVCALTWLTKSFFFAQISNHTAIDECVLYDAKNDTPLMQIKPNGTLESRPGLKHKLKFLIHPVTISSNR